MPTEERIKKQKKAELEAATSSASNIWKYFRNGSDKT